MRSSPIRASRSSSLPNALTENGQVGSKNTSKTRGPWPQTSGSASHIFFIRFPPSAWLSASAGREVRERVDRKITGNRGRERRGSRQHEALVVARRDLCAELPIAQHAAGVGHENTGLAGDVGAQVPGMLG